MLELKLPTAKTAVSSAKTVRTKVNKALLELFKNETLKCELHTLEDDAVFTITGKDFTTTIHFQSNE